MSHKEEIWLNAATKRLIHIWSEWCLLNGLEPHSADEMLALYNHELNASQEAFIEAYITLWDAVQESSI